MQDSSLQPTVDYFIQPKVLVTGENIPYIYVKKKKWLQDRNFYIEKCAVA